MKKKRLLIIITIIIGITLASTIITTKKDDEIIDKTFTKAICEKNVCQDYLIKCYNNKLVERTPLTGRIIMEKEWEDPRKESGRMQSRQNLKSKKTKLKIR